MTPTPASAKVTHTGGGERESVFLWRVARPGAARDLLAIFVGLGLFATHRDASFATV